MHRGTAPLIAALLALAAVVAPAPARADLVQYAGACVLDLRLTFSPASDATPTPTTIAFRGSGTCTVNDVVTTGVLQGVAATTPVAGWSCAVGYARGTGTFSTGHPSMPDQFVEVAIAQGPGTLELAAYALPVFEGVGTFAEAPAAVAACASGQPISAVQYTGPFAFQDPRVS